MENSQKYATHIEVRNELMKMQKNGGAMINPFRLYEVIHMLFTDEEQHNKNHIPRARIIATTFCAMCNEYFIYNCYEKNPNIEFYIPEDRWEKYFILPDVRDMSIRFLQKYGLIECCTKKLPPNDREITTYKINLELLQQFRRATEELHENERAKRNPLR